MEPRLPWGERTWVMGILNVTPDRSRGRAGDADRGIDEVVTSAVEQAIGFVAAGAEILDVGAESTRPRTAYGDRPSVDEATETALAIPVVRAVAEAVGDRAFVSIDTSKGVARAALDAGASIVNDVWAATRDPDTAVAAAEADAHLVLMHNQEAPGYPAGVFETSSLASVGDRGGRRARRRARADHRRPGHRLRQGDRREPRAASPAGGAQGSPRRAADARRHESQAVPRASSSMGLLRTTGSRPRPRPSPSPSPPARTSSGSTMSRTSPARAGSPMPSCADERPSDRLILRGMRFVARHGFIRRRRSSLSASRSTSSSTRTSRPAETDALGDTIDYSALHELVGAIVTGPSFDLIEALAGAIARAVLAATDSALVDAVEVRVRKPDAPIDGELDKSRRRCSGAASTGASRKSALGRELPEGHVDLAR